MQHFKTMHLFKREKQSQRKFDREKKRVNVCGSGSTKKGKWEQHKNDTTKFYKVVAPITEKEFIETAKI
jgi:hypothetical protein